MIETILQSLGLSAEEVDVYLVLLSQGGLSASEVAKASKVKRTYVYRVCEKLVGRGLVTIGKSGVTTIFSPLPPENLLTQAEAQKSRADEAQTALSSVLPTLQAQYRLIETRPVISYFEGAMGVKKVYLDTIKEGKPILALVQTSDVEKEIYDWVTGKYVGLRVGEGIEVRAIVATGEKTVGYVRRNEKELRETRLIDSKKYPLDHEINIYGDKVAIINHKRGSKLFGTIIDNPLVANTFRSWFELTWSSLG